jgi:predicted SnoaL-like aldol condensation-catalyzing enzyme
MSDHSIKQVAIEFLTLVVAGNIDQAFDRHVAASFRHHNPFFPGDAAALREAMQNHASTAPAMIFELQRAVQEGEQVMVFSRIRQSAADAGAAVVHIFRFEDGRIAELWDVAQEVPKDAVNQNGMF